MLHAAQHIDTLRIPPHNRLEVLKGDRKGQWSIRINDQWRVCFVWQDGAAWDVETLTIIKEQPEMAKRKIPLATPGKILLEEFLKPLGITQYRVAKEIGVPQRRIGEIVAGKRAITADTAARFGVFFGMEAEFWLNLQAHYDLVQTREVLADRLAEIQPLTKAA